MFTKVMWPTTFMECSQMSIQPKPQNENKYL